VDTPPKASRGVDVFLAIVTIGFLAAGVASIKYYFDNRGETAELAANGVETEAEVSSISVESHGSGRGVTIRALVSYDPQGPGLVEFTEVVGCSEETIDRDAETLRITYLPDDPESVRLADCVTSVDSWLPIVAGIAFSALGLYLAWRLVRSWTS
jgi:hypothetical protein